ncbi:MAG: HDOD domain-containing protein [Planctomycetota bacterium]
MSGATSNTDTIIPCVGTWWENESFEGELYLPGQSALDKDGRGMLDDLATASDKGMLEIPPMPKVAMSLVKLMRSPDTDLDDIADTIKIDPTMTATVLRYANSSLFGARHTIDNIYHATSYLGTKRLKSVVLEAALKKLSGNLAAVEYSRMEWVYSIHAATISRKLALIFGLDPETCYLAGLLHDIGRLPILINIENRGKLSKKPQVDDSVDIVIEVLHRGVGKQVADSWDLPPAIVDAISSHLTGRLPDEESLAQFDSTRVAEAAGDLCIAMGLGRFQRPHGILEAPSLIDLGFTPTTLRAFLENDIPEIITEVAKF